MSEDSVVVSVIRQLESLGLPYMVVGSYASNVWGRPRSSFDADIVVDLQPADADRFIAAVAGEYAVEPESLRRDIERGSMFNLIPLSGMFKVDIIPLRRTPFARAEFERRRPVQALGRTLWMASPEDTILFKLSWFRDGDEASGRHVEDARDVLAAQGTGIDHAYLDHWAGELGVRDLLDRIRGTIGPGGVP